MKSYAATKEFTNEIFATRKKWMEKYKRCVDCDATGVWIRYYELMDEDDGNFNDQKKYFCKRWHVFNFEDTYSDNDE